MQPDPALQWSHVHSIGYHQATGRLVVCCGDGCSRAQIWYTDNPADGIPTWVRMYATPDEQRAQPMALLDFGDPSRLLFGDDEARGVGYLDVLTGAVTNALPVTDGRWPHNLYWEVFRDGGTYYALSADSSGTNQMQTVLASRDGSNWAVYYKLPSNYQIIRWFGGDLAGRLHIYGSGGGLYQWMALRPAQMASYDGVLLEPATTNLIAGSTGHFDDDSHGWTCPGHTLVRDLTDNYGPGAVPACLKVTCNGIPISGVTVMPVYSPPAAGLLNGTQYGGSVWMRTVKGCMLVILQLVDQSGATSAECQYFVDNTAWREYRTLPLRTGSAGGVSVAIQVKAYPTPGSTGLKLDNAQTGGPADHAGPVYDAKPG